MASRMAGPESGQGRRWEKVLALLPAVALILLWGRWSVDLPVADDWSRLDFACRAHDGQLRWQECWTTENEHRVFVPRVVAATLARLTSWNLRAEMLASAGALLLAALWLGTRWPRRARGLLFLSLLWGANPHAWEVVTWASCANLAWAQLFTLGALGLAAAPRLGSGRLGAGVACAVAASISFSSGFVVWPLLALAVVTQTGASARTRWVQLLVLSLAAAGLAWAHLSLGRVQSGPLPEVAASLATFVRFAAISFGSALLGESAATDLAYRIGLAGAGGLASGLVLVVARGRLRDEAERLTAGLGLFGLLLPGLIAYGRVPISGLNLAGASRYALFASLGWLALSALLALHLRPRRCPALGSVLAGLLALPLLVTAPSSWKAARERSEELAAAREIFARREGFPPASLRAVFGADPIPRLPALGPGLEALRRRRLTLFRHHPAAERAPVPPRPAPLELALVSLLPPDGAALRVGAGDFEDAPSALVLLGADGATPELKRVLVTFTLSTGSPLVGEVRLRPEEIRAGGALQAWSLDRFGRIRRSARLPLPSRR